MNKADNALLLFEEGFSCSQAILATYGPELGLERETALRVAEGFVGGIACLGHTCGAVAGAVMAIGLKHGRTDAADRNSQGKTIREVRKFVKEFEKRNGTTTCRELLKCRIDTPAREKAAQARGLFKRVCPRAVRDAAEILEEILAKEETTSDDQGVSEAGPPESSREE